MHRPSSLSSSIFLTWPKYGRVITKSTGVWETIDYGCHEDATRKLLPWNLSLCTSVCLYVMTIDVLLILPSLTRSAYESVRESVNWTCMVYSGVGRSTVVSFVETRQTSLTCRLPVQHGVLDVSVLERGRLHRRRSRVAGRGGARTAHQRHALGLRTQVPDGRGVGATWR